MPTYSLEEHEHHCFVSIVKLYLALWHKVKTANQIAVYSAQISH